MDILPSDWLYCTFTPALLRIARFGSLDNQNISQ